MFIKFLQDSVLKRSTDQASKLSDDNKYSVRKDEEYIPNKILLAEDNHIKFELKSPLKGIYNWYAFQPHFELVDSSGKLLSLNHQDIANLDNSAPQTGTIKIPDQDRPIAKEDLVNVIGVGRVDLYGNISGTNFTWAEATHNGTRLPVIKEHTDNIIKLAKQLQTYRKDLNKPFHITSWYRPEPFNSRAGGARFSQHLYGGAVDLYIDGMDKWDMRKYFDPTWKGGLGTYSHLDIIHLDVRNWNSRW